MLEDCNGDEGRYTSPVRCVALRAGGRAGWLAAMRRMRCDAMRRDALEMHAQVGYR